tara:strand:+ start:378 stop:557 length:180 start_codon:yes stop_codon:yes gene_type:complete
MANQDQKTILTEQTYKDIKEICKTFQDDSGSSNSEVKALLIELASLWGNVEEKNKFGFR